MRRDLGDFQTPPALVAAVLDLLGPIGSRWPRVLEPTCGRGHFLSGLLGQESPPREILGIEIQPAYVSEARAAVGEPAGTRVKIVQGSLFDLDLRRDLVWAERGPLLVLGNPPWITNAELGLLGSENLPRKRNLKGLLGLDARTGSANFDIAEAIWLKLLDELAEEDATIALLCKSAVARAVLADAQRRGLSIAESSIHRIDAAKWFHAAVDGCLLQVRLGPGSVRLRVPVFASLSARTPSSVLGFAKGGLVADGDVYASCACVDGASPLAWRQGVKHDAAAVMELTCEAEPPALRNKLGEPVDIEPDHVYPLVKGSDLARSELAAPHRAVIVTQRRLGEDTDRLEQAAPRLWAYMQRHAGRLAERKSSIYRNQPPFALFGIGPYSFAPYKVAVSGLHKTPRFHAFGPFEGRPVFLDDTCYFLPFDRAQPAALAAALLNEPLALGLLSALLFRDAKRPVTKGLLQRLDLSAILDRADRAALLARADEQLVRLGGRSDGWPDRLDLLLLESEVPVPAGSLS